jgi:2-dehydropantoate 2-reductase
VASHIKEKGMVEHKGKAGKMIIGRDPEHFSADVDWIIEMLKESKIDFDFKDNSLTDIWTKYTFIASFGLVTAKHNSSIGAVCSDENQKKEATEIMKEIKKIADKKMIVLDEDIIQKTFEKAATFPFETPTSLQLDVNSGKENNELELLGGAILEFGKELRIDTPFTQKIYNEIKSL